MKMKKSVALLLVFTLIVTLFSTFSVISPSATEGESTETTSYNTNVLYAKALESLTNGRAIYIKVPKESLTAGESYTVSVNLYGKTLTSNADRLLHVRESTAKTSTYPELMLAASNTSTVSTVPETAETGTITRLLSGGSKWTATITPSAENDIYIGLRLGTSNYASALIYLGGFELIDRNGVNIAPALESSTVIYGATNHQQGISEEKDTNWDTIEVKDIGEVTDEDMRQGLINDLVDFEEGSMLNFTPATTTGNQAVFKKIPAEKLTAGTKYKLSIKYSGAEFGDTNYFLIRNNTTATNDTDSQVVLSSEDTGEFVEHRNYTEYIDYYTVPETPTDLYIGFYLPTASWTALENLYIGEIKFTDVNGNTIEVSLGDMSDMRKATSATGAISDFASNVYIICKKQPFDSSIFANAQTEQKQVVNIEKNGSNSCRVYVRVHGVLPGNYQVSYETKGLISAINATTKLPKAGTATVQQFDVRTVTAGAYNTEVPVLPTLVTEDFSSFGEMTYSFSIEGEDFKDVFIGFYVHPNTVNGFNYFIENLSLTKMVDGVAGENLIDPDLYLTTWYRHSNSTSATNPWTKFSLTDGTGGYSVITVTLMDDEDERYTSLFDAPHVNFKVQGINQGYAKKADDLDVGKYRLTIIEHGADIQTKNYPQIVIKYGAVDNLNEITTRNEDIRANCVEKVEGKKSTYKFTYEFTLEEGQDTVYAGMYTTDSVDANIYITELSLVKVDGETVSENLFTPLCVRDWCDSTSLELLTNFDGYYGYTNSSGGYRGIKYRDTTIVDVNEDGSTNIVDLLILSKLEDAGITLTDTINDLVTVRNTILNPTTE